MSSLRLQQPLRWPPGWYRKRWPGDLVTCPCNPTPHHSGHSVAHRRRKRPQRYFPSLSEGAQLPTPKASLK